MKISRRSFVVTGAGLISVVAGLPQVATSQTLPNLSESDSQAQALGYREDATKVDKAKYPKYAAGQDCATCQLYLGKAGDARGACPLFAGKSVAAKGWCASWIKKA